MNATAGAHYGTLEPLRQFESEMEQLEGTMLEARPDEPALVSMSYVRRRLAETRESCENVDNELDVPVAAKLSGRSGATIRRWCKDDFMLGTKRAGQWVVCRDRLLEKIGGPVRLDDSEEAA